MFVVTQRRRGKGMQNNNRKKYRAKLSLSKSHRGAGSAKETKGHTEDMLDGVRHLQGTDNGYTGGGFDAKSVVGRREKGNSTTDGEQEIHTYLTTDNGGCTDFTTSTNVAHTLTNKDPGIIVENGTGTGIHTDDGARQESAIKVRKTTGDRTKTKKRNASATEKIKEKLDDGANGYQPANDHDNRVTYDNEPESTNEGTLGRGSRAALCCSVRSTSSSDSPLGRRLQQASQALLPPPVLTSLQATEGTADEGPALHEYRILFRQELLRLRTELDTFRQFCSQQIQQEANRVTQNHGRQLLQQVDDDDQHATDHVASSTAVPGRTMQPAENGDKSRLQMIEEQETKLEKREAALAEKQKDLHQYEREILEIESMLNQRQAICERRQTTLVALDEVACFSYVLRPSCTHLSGVLSLFLH
ncbi:hypothetical protein BaRGS_00004446 [Batillaria attramentaria]|uniref:Uncharacterized protein n=1 Tax=Batillaria attramentaria TaxID=370345 RepID=A0ABD0LXL0_9CAEN